ncbi:hypothetical protein ACFVZ3_06430 [Kitasatospora purpeofusca]|uniref:hypothetical protein n=1 Tax=Kitasatospora purpeofusca TaxID=67352 RepID=UPI0036B694DD
MVTVYDTLAPDEDQLRAALAALALPVPEEIESLEDGARTAALAGHLLRAATRATHNLVNAAPDLGGAGRRAEAVFPHDWPIAEDHRQVALIELAWTADRLDVLHGDQHSENAVLMDSPDAKDDDEGVEQVEAHAAGTWAAVEAAKDLVTMRLDPPNPALAHVTLDLVGDHIDRLTNAYQELAHHHGHPAAAAR